MGFKVGNDGMEGDPEKSNAIFTPMIFNLNNNYLDVLFKRLQVGK
jgi:hypothetical protein